MHRSSLAETVSRRTQELELAYEQMRRLASELEVRSRALQDQNIELRAKSMALEAKQRELDHKNRELQRSSQLKSEFLANISHELRTPLNSIIGFTDIVYAANRDVLEERHLLNLERVKASATQLLDMINALLDFSKIEAGKMDVKLSRFDLESLLEQCAAATDVILRSPNVHVISEVKGHLPRFEQDEGKLRQILLNLMSNAAKFTPAGTITLRAEPIGDGEWVALTVTDTGYGIPADEHDRIFEDFRQVEITLTGKKPVGTGLGLAIVRRLARLLGGDVSVESERGRGSTFVVMLPAVHPDAHDVEVTVETLSGPQRQPEGLMADAGAAAGGGGVRRAVAARSGAGDEEEVLMSEPAELPRGELEGRTLLCIDSDPQTVVSVRELLGATGAHVASAFDGRTATRRLTENPDVVLLDARLVALGDPSLDEILAALPAAAPAPAVVVVTRGTGESAPADERVAATLRWPPEGAWTLLQFVHRMLEQSGRAALATRTGARARAGTGRMPRASGVLPAVPVEARPSPREAS
jgi:signal transduction histidine kinase/CheY-like chemotaxis protein